MSGPVIFTSYFSQKKHPNDPNDSAVIGRSEDGRVLQNSFEYIKNWYNSIIDLGLEARVFYDNLSGEFLEKYETDKIKFIYVSTSDYSNNDWRFFCYRNYLVEHNDFDSVFLTDGSDVVVVKDPSKILLDFPDTDYFICKDSIKLGQFPYLDIHKQIGWENTNWFESVVDHTDLINMGVIGGSYSNIVTFLNKFCSVRKSMKNEYFNADMWVGQYVFRHKLSDKKLLIGEPFTSNFKQYENDRKDVYFIHK